VKRRPRPRTSSRRRGAQPHVKRAQPAKPAKPRSKAKSIATAPVTAAELRQLRSELTRKLEPMRWNPEPEDVQRSVAQLVLTIVEFLRKLMERQAIRRMEQKTLTEREVEAVGDALMKLEQTIREIGARFGLAPEDLNLDLGPLGKLM